MKTTTPGQGKLAISYIRFSSPEQAKGDSIRRQTEATEAYCIKHGLTLTEKYRLRDAGVSAFRGANLEPTSALGGFLNQVNQGLIPSGTCLIVESLDRLSREKVRKALTVFLNLIDKGIEIVALADNERKFTADTVDKDSMSLVGSIMVMVRAHEESLMKSKRVKDSWVIRHRLASQGEFIKIQTPGWLTKKNRAFVVIPEKIQIIKRIFKLCLDGYGSLTIAGMFNREKVPTLSNKSQKANQLQWHPHYILRILKNRSLIGYYTNVNPEVPNYYPRIVSDNDFYAVQAKLKERITYKGQRNKTPYVFSHLMKCSVCGETLFRTVDNGYSYLRCMGHKKGGCKVGFMNYPSLEKTMLSVISNMESSSVEYDSDYIERENLELASLKGRLDDIESKIETASKLFVSNPSEAGTKILKQLEDDHKAIKKLLHEKTSVKYLIDQRANWKEVKARIKSGILSVESEYDPKTGQWTNTVTQRSEPIPEWFEITPVSIRILPDGKLEDIRHEEKEPGNDLIIIRENIRAYVKQIIIDIPKMQGTIHFRTGRQATFEMKKTKTIPIKYHYKTADTDWTEIKTS